MEARRLLTVISEREVGEMLAGIEAAVNRSAVVRPQPILTEAQRITRDEWVRRAQWCIERTLDIKKQHRWPVERIVDWLPTALVSWLDGVDPKVDNRAGWSSETPGRFDERYG